MNCTLTGAHRGERAGTYEAIAHLEPVKIEPHMGHGPYDLCERCLLNKLKYWPEQVSVEALAGHQGRVAEVTAEAIMWRSRGNLTEPERAKLAAATPVFTGRASMHDRNPVTSDIVTQEVDTMAPAATAPARAKIEFAVGQQLTASYQGKTYLAEVRLDPETDKATYHITDGGTAAIRKVGYTSPSGMGRAVTGRSSCDGYTFWKVVEEGGAKAKASRKPKAATKAASKTRAKRTAA